MDIIWKEQGFIYNEEYRELNEQTLLLDGRLSREEAAAHPHVYCDIQELLPVVNFGRESGKSHYHVHCSKCLLD